MPGLIRIPQVPLPQGKKIEDHTESNENADLNPLLRVDFGK